MHRKIAVGITGASGALYAKVLLDKLAGIPQSQLTTGVVMSDNARLVWEYELGNDAHSTYPFTFYGKSDFMSPIASGSARYDTLIVCPCSMGTLGRIASGVSDDLLTRAADVMLKERRKLILVVRETPYNLIHLRNMETITLAGGIICPASPSFYSKPQDFEQMASTVIDRVLQLAGFDAGGYRWNDPE